SPALCFSNCVLRVRAGRRSAGGSAAPWRPGSGSVTRSGSHFFVLLALSNGGGTGAARHTDASRGNLDRQRCSFCAGIGAPAAHGAVPRGKPLAPSHDLLEIQKTSVAPAESPGSRQSRSGKRGEWRPCVTGNPDAFQRKFPAIDRHLCLAALLFLFR